MPKLQPEVRLLDISSIDVGEQQLRETPEDDAIGELAESIASKGLLQPIGVTKSEDDRYQLRWGHRRLLAHLRLGRRQIKAAIYDGEERSIKGLALVENLHRSAMTITDEVEAVNYLADVEGKSVEQIAAIVNKRRGWVLDRMMIPHLPLFLQQPLLAGELPFSHVEIISKVPDEGAQRYLTAQCVVNRWNKSSLKTIAECYMTPIAQDPDNPRNIAGINPNPANAPFLYTCQICTAQDTLEKFDLVRVHKDGYGCRTEADRSNHQSNSINGLERDSEQHGRPDDQNPDRKA
ncbi:MAG TPA: ParB/RepB/Spo0J family partition protein [Candidatus Binatia bacterium]|jgi:ParB family chromosome partitioning protein|nr:ParB/RepB/Spo0J family partition protein [Candidatus Binatia bacterium]